MQSVSDENGGTSTSSVGTIGSRLSKELKKNLGEKLNIYLNRGEEATHAALIFSDCVDLWTTEKAPVIVTSEPLPPIPADYDHENFDIVKDIREYVEQLAEQVAGCSPFHASSVTFGTEDSSLQIHLIFSQHDEPARVYLNDDDDDCDCSLQSSTSTSASTTMGQAQCRQYSSGSVDAKDCTILNLLIEKEWEDESSSSMSDESSSVYYSAEDETTSEWTTPTSASEDESRKLRHRLGYTLVQNLKRKMEIYAKRFGATKYNPVIFTDNERLWRTDKEPWLVFHPMPPISRLYDHENFDICFDINAYMREEATRLGIQPLYISLVTYGPLCRLKVHIVLSQEEVNIPLYMLCFKLRKTEFLPSVAWSAPIKIAPAAGSSQPKRQRQDTAKSAPPELPPSKRTPRDVASRLLPRDDSLEEIEELPTDTVPINAETSL